MTATWIHALITTIGVIAAAWIAGRWNVRKSRVEASAAPYEQVSKRVVALEEQVAKLWAENEELKTQLAEGRAQMSDLKRWVTACVAWLEFHEIDHSQLPAPPSWLCPR